MAEDSPSPDAVASEYFTANATHKIRLRAIRGRDYSRQVCRRCPRDPAYFADIFQAWSKRRPGARSSKTANRSRAARAVALVAVSWCRSPRSRHAAWPRWLMSYPSQGTPSCAAGSPRRSNGCERPIFSKPCATWNECPTTTEHPWPWPISGWEFPARFSRLESCSIHADRPLVCREYLVTSPAANCAQPTEENIKRVRAANASFPDPAHARKPNGARETPWVALVMALELAETRPDLSGRRPGPEWVTLLLTSLTAARSPHRQLRTH